MKVLVSGSSGFVGSVLQRYLCDLGHEVIRLVRSSSRVGKTEVFWDPAGGVLDLVELKGCDAVIHLAGENLATGRWTQAKKERIRASRIQSTRLLAETIARLESPPKILASASGIGIYGNRGDELLTEESPAGNGFLADICGDWEEGTAPAAERGVRVVQMRFGMILSPQGGALKEMLPPFRLGLGAVLGHGEQHWSWVTIDDTIRAIHHVLVSEPLSGPVNIVSPAPVSNRGFTKQLAAVLKRPAFMTVPAFAARLIFGEMANEMLLSSARVQPQKLLNSGFQFRHSRLSEALENLLR